MHKVTWGVEVDQASILNHGETREDKSLFINFVRYSELQLLTIFSCPGEIFCCTSDINSFPFIKKHVSIFFPFILFFIYTYHISIHLDNFPLIPKCWQFNCCVWLTVRNFLSHQSLVTPSWVANKSLGGKLSGIKYTKTSQ